MSYAETTTVPIERTRAEIETLLVKHGANEFTSSWSERDWKRVARIGVRMKDRMLLFELPMPLPTERRFTHVTTWRPRAASAALKLYEQACRSRWRALLLTIKAKLESVESGIETFEDAFLAQVLLPDGKTMGSWARPVIARVYGGAPMPTTLLLGSGDDIIEGG